MPEALCSWRALLLRIGDKCSEYGGTVDYREHIDTCYGVIWREFDHYRDDILELILQCAEQLPHKIPFYGVLVGLLNLEKEDFAKEIVDNTHSSLQRGLDEGDCNGVRISMRFLTCLMCSNVISPNFIVEIFETLLSSAAIIVDEESGNPSWQARADFYISCILSSLPWGGAELNEQVPEEFDRVLVGVQSYLNIRQRSPDILYSVFDTHCDSGIEGKDFLEDLWDRIQLLSHNGWKADSVPRPYLTFEAQLVSGNAYTLSPINCPHQSPLSLTRSTISREREKHEAELKFPRRLQRLNIFPSNKVEDMEPIDRFVVEEYLLDVLFFFNGCRKECATYLVGLPVPFRYEYLMAETIFSQLLLLPHAPFKSMYYTLVIIDLCKALPGAFPAVVVGAVRSLFEKIDDLDMECRSRLVLWFSHHLANFQYVWPWEEWAYVKDLPKWAPQRIFVQEILEREIRLCYFEKIKQSIENAPALEELLPPKGSPCFKYSTIDSNNQELSDGQKLSSELNNMIKARKNSREITQWMDENIITSHGREFAAEIVIQTLMDIGSKSFTHLITALERYGQVISKLSFELEMQVFVINVITSYWKNSAQMAAIAIDRMMGYRLISNMAIVNWVFSEPNVGEFHLSYRPWEILRNTINKTFNRISDLRKEIKALEKGILLAEEASEKAQKEYEFAERKLEVVDGQPVQAERPGRLKRLKAYAEKAKSEESSIRESREAKEALLVRALEENKVLFISLYKNFKYVLMERLPLFSPDGKLPNLKVQKDIMSVDLEKVPKMEVDHENGNSDDRNTPDGERSTGSYIIGEVEQWCLTTLGHLKAISRQYSTEIWPHIEVVDAEIFNEEIHPLFKKAVYDGLGRSDQ